MQKELIAFANTLADAARGIITPLFRTQLEREHKEADSPVVTVADREAERVMRELIEQRFPNHGIVGEEFGEKKTASAHTWVLDPVDGTIAFSMGKVLFGTLIGLLEEGRPVLGVIDQPVLAERWIGGTDLPTQFNGKPVRTSATESLKRAAIATTSPFMFETPKQEEMIRQLKKRAQLFSFGGDCYNYALLASGHVDAVIERQLKTHDWAALVPVIEAAGGVVTDWEGNTLTLASAGDVVATANPALHRELLALTRGCA